MSSYLALVVAVCIFLCVCIAHEIPFNGRHEPLVIGPQGKQVYIRGQNEGTYTVSGVDGVYKNSPSRGEHVYTDDRGNTYYHRSKDSVGPAVHSINDPDILAIHGLNMVSRVVGKGNILIGSDGNIDATRKDRRGLAVKVRDRRNVVVSRPNRTVYYGPDGFSVVRNRRSNFQINRPDHLIATQTFRRRRGISDARVQGGNFVAREDQACVWNSEGLTVCRRPDGRTVTMDVDGNVITSGSPNGRGPQHYSG